MNNAAIVQMSKIMRKNTVKRSITSLATVTVLLFLFSACQKPVPVARFDYSIQSGSTYATCKLTNYSENADSYEWTLTRPDGTIDHSSLFQPSFQCWEVGTYNVTLYAQNLYGNDRATQSFYISYFGGGSGGGNNGGGNNNPTATAYTITWLRLEKIPMLDGNNGSWDTGLFGGGNPDIYFMIQDASNSTTYYTSAVKEDVAESDLPVTWYGVSTTLEKGKEYRVKFVDQDGALDLDDVMANCIWEQAGYFSPGATSFTWNNGAIRFTVGLSWAYTKSDDCEITQGYTDNTLVEGNLTPVHNHQ